MFPNFILFANKNLTTAPKIIIFILLILRLIKLIKIWIRIMSFIQLNEVLQGWL